MGKRRTKVKSVPQRNLMGYAYACATGKIDNCPPSIEKVAKSFTKKKQGLKSLRRLAKTKHAGLSPVAISEDLTVLKFKDFIVKEGILQDDPDESTDVIFFLYSLEDFDINLDVNEFLTSSDKETKNEYIEDIMKTIQRKHKTLDKDKVYWIEDNLKKRILEDDKRKHK